MERKEFKVVGKSVTMDAEFNCRTLLEAELQYAKMKESGWYEKVYIMSNTTGELFKTYDIEIESGGVKVTEWYQM